MTPFFGIDLTTNKKNHQLSGQNFLAKKPSAALTQSLNASAEKAEEKLQRAKLPLPLRIFQFLCGIVALVFAIGILEADLSFAAGYRNAAWIYWTAGICLAAWLALTIWSVVRSRSVLGAEESRQTFSGFDRLSDAIFEDLNVPANAKAVDILSFFYKVDNDGIRVCEKPMQMAPYINLEFKLFADQNAVYLVNLEGRYAFPRSSLLEITTVDKHIRLHGWNKEEAYNKGIYKPYQLTTDGYHTIHCTGYHILRINHNGTSWGIYFPSYELPAFEEVTGLQAQPDV